MKTSITLVIMTITMLLLALPAGAIDYTLGIFGNANEDEMINMQDVTFTELIILEYKDATELADAKYDSEIDILDVTQIELTILGKEKELTLLDSANRIVTVNKPVERVIAGHINTAEAISLLEAWDRVVGIDIYTTDEILFPGASNLPVIRGFMAEDMYYETIFELDPNIFIMRHFSIVDWTNVIDTLEPDIPFVCLEFADPDTLAENIRKLSYILNTEDKGEEFIAFYEGVVNDITEETAGLTDEDKPQVFVWPLFFDYTEQYAALAGDFPGIQSQFEIVGAKNIAEDLVGWFPPIGDEWLIGEDIDVILCGISPAPVIPGVCGYDIDDTTVIRETRDWVMDEDENPALVGSNAVTNGNVYLYSFKLGTSTRFVVAMAYWAKWLHPELFSDLDPQAIHQEYLDLLGIDYDLNEHGVLFYPGP